MNCVKNYETVPKFVKVMARILWPLFFPDTVYIVYFLTTSVGTYSSIAPYVGLPRYISC